MKCIKTKVNYFNNKEQKRKSVKEFKLIIHEENTKKNHIKRVVSVYVIQIHVDLHKL